MFRHGMFLIKVINNEYDGFDSLKKAQMTFNQKGQKLSRDKVGFHSQMNKFGENSASAMVILSAQMSNLGRIIHANDEIEALLGYKRSEILNKNVTCIMPRIIGQFHDGFIRRYLDSGVNRVIDQERQSFAETKDQYIMPIDLLVKIYPEINGQIIFVGFVQKSEGFHEMDEPPQEYEGKEQHYIITNRVGYISSVTSGMLMSLGIHPRCFNYQIDSITSQISIEKICPSVLDPSNFNILEHEGMVLDVDTRNILACIELEKFSHEEIQLIKTKVCQCSAYVQLKKLHSGEKSDSFIYIYRFIPLGQVQNPALAQLAKVTIQNDTNKNDKVFKLKSNMLGLNGDQLFNSHDSHSQQSSDLKNQSMSSMSSQSSTTQGISTVVRDFKKSLSEKTTPRTLVFVNRMMIVIISAIIILSSVVFAELQKEIMSLAEENIHNLKSERRRLGIVQLSFNIRTYINTANDLARNDFSLEALNEIIERKQFLQKLIQQQQVELQDIHNYIMKKRFDQDSGTDQLQREFEYQDVGTLTLDDKNNFISYKQPFRLAMNDYLNDALMLNKTNATALHLTTDILLTPPQENLPQSFGKTTLCQKQSFKLITNGCRSLRQKADEATIFQQETSFSNLSIQSLLTIMIVSVVISLFSVALVFYQIIQIEHIQSDILSLYSYLRNEHIQEVFNNTLGFMREISHGSFIRQIAPIRDPSTTQKNTSGKNPKKGFKQKNENGYTASHEESDLEVQESKKNANSGGKSPKKGYQVSNSHSSSTFEGSFSVEESLTKYTGHQKKDIYLLMMKRSIQEIKILQNKEIEMQQEQERGSRPMKKPSVEFNEKQENVVKNQKKRKSDSQKKQKVPQDEHQI